MKDILLLNTPFNLENRLPEAEYTVHKVFPSERQGIGEFARMKSIAEGPYDAIVIGEDTGGELLLDGFAVKLALTVQVYVSPWEENTSLVLLSERAYQNGIPNDLHARVYPNERELAKFLER